MIKKRSVLLMILIMVLHSVFSAGALANEVPDKGLEVVGYSEAFPDAFIDSYYIPLDNVTVSDDQVICLRGNDKLNELLMSSKKVEQDVLTAMESGNAVGVAVVEAYVKEVYETIDEKTVCTESRLLTESELKANGIDPTIGDIVDTTNDGIGKLTLTLTVYEMDLPAGYKYELEYGVVGSAQWDAGYVFQSPNTVGTYDDYMGFYWDSDDFTGIYGDSCALFYGSDTGVAHRSDSVADSVAWYFQDFRVGNTDPFLEQATAYMHLYNKYKQNSEGFVSLKYIHTYEGVDISGTISYLIGSIDIDVVECSWPLAISVRRLPN